MADLTDIQATDVVRIVGATSTGLEQTPVNSSLAGDLYTRDMLAGSGVQGAIALSTSAVEAKVGGSRVSSRKCLSIQPTNGVIYWGYLNTVTTTTGSPIFKNQSKTFAIGDAPIYIIAAGSVDVRVTEGS